MASGRRRALFDAGEDPCGAGGLEEYHFWLHVLAVFVLLAVSLAGSLLPVWLHIGRHNRGTLTAVKLGTFFGIGTILSTSFIHMLLPAHESLTSPCLPETWTKGYEAWAFLLAVLAILTMQLIDFVSEQLYQRVRMPGIGAGTDGTCSEQTCEPHMPSIHDSQQGLDGLESAASADSPTQALRVESLAEPAADESMGLLFHAHSHAHGHHVGHGHGLSSSGSARDRSRRIAGVYMMEAGIVFHSFLIGLVLGVAAGEGFLTLLIALSLHQFFEGFAIGSAAVDSGVDWRRAVLMALVFSVTTPAGCAAGIAVHSWFNHNADTALLAAGIGDAVSAGVLIYVVLAQLLNPLMTHSPWLHSRPPALQALCFAALYSGTAVMAAIGKWV